MTYPITQQIRICRLRRRTSMRSSWSWSTSWIRKGKLLSSFNQICRSRYLMESKKPREPLKNRWRINTKSTRVCKWLSKWQIVLIDHLATATAQGIHPKRGTKSISKVKRILIQCSWLLDLVPKNTLHHLCKNHLISNSSSKLKLTTKTWLCLMT